MAKQSDIARHLGISTRHVRTILDDLGLPSRDCDLDVVRDAYIKHLREVAAGRASENGELDLVKERARLARAQATDKEIDIAVKQGELIPAHEVEEQWSRAIVAVKLSLLALPDRLQRILQLNDDQRNRLDTEIRGTLEKLAATE